MRYGHLCVGFCQSCAGASDILSSSPAVNSFHEGHMGVSQNDPSIIRDSDTQNPPCIAYLYEESLGPSGIYHSEKLAGACWDWGHDAHGYLD